MGRDFIDLMFRAFSDRSRLRILHLLQGGDSCVGDIVEALRLPQPKVSRHLGYLRKAGLVVVRKAGLWCFYSLAPVQSPFHKKLLDCIGCCFGDVPELRADARRAAKLKAAGGCCPKPR
jgi:ArsR family transcriptional regulator